MLLMRFIRPVRKRISKDTLFRPFGRHLPDEKKGRTLLSAPPSSRPERECGPGPGLLMFLNANLDFAHKFRIFALSKAGSAPHGAGFLLFCRPRPFLHHGSGKTVLTSVFSLPTFDKTEGRKGFAATRSASPDGTFRPTFRHLLVKLS